MQNDYTDLEELRRALLEDISDAGDSLLKIKLMTKSDQLESLMPAWKWQRFNQSLCDAAVATLKAMDCLNYKESPKTISLVQELINRWNALPNAKERDEVVDILQKAFTKKTTEEAK